MHDDIPTREPEEMTKNLCAWCHDLQLQEVPKHVQDRAKLIILDGIGCGLVGAQLPWSETAARAVLDFEPPGSCSLFGWPNRLSAPAAALLNSTFIQGFELDDWHPRAPLHSAALLLPALFAMAEHLGESESRIVTGESFLLAMVIGLETGPRIGLSVGGADLLSRGWHSGAIFGGPAVALATSKLMGFSLQQTEWALGTACTQAGGLMSAQFGSMTKRMQHGFAARNGLLAVLLARANYTGIEGVLERSYGGFIGLYSGNTSVAQIEEAGGAFANLGTVWHSQDILIKPYPLMAGLHASVNCIEHLQKAHMDKLKIDLASIKEIEIQMGEAAFKHGGWKVETDCLEVTGAQMSAAYAVAVQLLDGKITPRSFSSQKLNRATLLSLIRKTRCQHCPKFDRSLKTQVTITMDDDTHITHTVEFPRGVKPKLSDEEIIQKWKTGTGEIIDEQRRESIETNVTTIEELKDVRSLMKVLRQPVNSVLN